MIIWFVIFNVIIMIYHGNIFFTLMVEMGMEIIMLT